MQGKLLPEAEQYTKRNNLRRIWRKIVRFLACVVVFCTTYTLILPAITMEQPCELEEHTHSQSCYTQVTMLHVSTLTCSYESLGVHTHTEACYTEENTLRCGLADYIVHEHGEVCLDESGTLVCQLPEVTEHTHSEVCYQTQETADQTHTHDDTCYTIQQGEQTCQTAETEGHIHASGCYIQGSLLCQQEESEEHTHGTDCYEAVLNCGREESEGHTHSDDCYEQEKVLSCTVTEENPQTDAETSEAEFEAEQEPELICTETEIQLHTHGDDCYEVYTDEEGAEQTRLICTQTVVLEHTHSDACFTVTEVPLDNIDTLTCGLVETEGHAHAEECYDENGQLLCNGQVDAHTHSALCYGTWERICGKDEHVHDETCQPEADEEVSIYSCGLLEHSHTAECYDAEGSLICEQTEHSHADSECVQTVSDDVAYVIGLIEGIPSADEIDAKIAEFQAAGDTAGEEAWLEQVYQDVAEAYLYYNLLSEEKKSVVVNAQKLLELEYIWSVTTYSTGYTWTAPTLITDAAHTSDFITINLYDYTADVNSSYSSNRTIGWSNSSGSSTGATSKYPGFQWNGGAYMQSGTFSRYNVDYIDFGNSLITDGNYTGSSTDITYGKNASAVNVAVNRDRINTDSSDPKIINNINTIEVSDDYGVTNRPIGMSLNSYGDAASTTNDILTRIATPAGYPALSNLVGGGSLAYLFGGSLDASVVKQNTASIDGLFQINETTGEYYYNSRQNHAQLDLTDYDGDGNKNEFLLFEQFITPNFIVYPFGNFLPLNSITNSAEATKISNYTYLKDYIGAETIVNLTGTTDASEKQLLTMLGKYRTSLVNSGEWDTISPLGAIQDYFWGIDGSSDDNPSSNTNPIIAQYNAGKIYNIDFDVKTNFFFGMDMTMNLMQPKDGMTGKDNGNNDNPLVANSNGDLVRAGEPDGLSDYPMQFYFTGDDDVWVYIDGILYLDLSGIHRHVGGEIDFQQGKVRYYALDTAGSGDVEEGEENAYQVFTFAEIVREALRYKNRDALNAGTMTTAQLEEKVNEIVDPDTGRFYDYSTHTFKFFYMERGSGSSVCRMNFNFPILKENTLTITKENVPKEYDADGNLIETNTTLLGNPDYYFNVIKKDESGLFITPNTQYKILDSAGNQIGTGEVDQYGIITLKAGQSAVFEGIAENAGSYYVQELIKNDDHELYAGQVMINGKNSMTDGVVNWGARSWYTGEYDSQTMIGPYGYAWLFYSSYYADASLNSAFYFEAQNGVITNRLAQLSITKKVNAYEPTRSVTYYKLQVELDGQPLPAGLTYTVTAADGSTRKETVITETDEAGYAKSYVLIAADETATITNILSGTRFTVIEHPDSAAGYNVFYSQTGAERVTTGTSLSGIARVDSEVAATVTNAENGTQLAVPISGTKSFLKAADTDHAYTFVLEQVELDAETGTVTSATDGVKLEETVHFTGSFASFSFDSLEYLAREFEQFPTNRYYLIYETGETATALDNTQQFLVQVTISQDTTSTATEKPISAAITGVWEGYVQDGQYIKVTQLSSDTSNGLPVSFVNILKDSLIVSKTVDGSTSAKQEDFSFTLTLEAGDSGVDPAGRTLRYQKTTAEGTETGSFRYEGTAYSFALKHGESFEVLDLPVGTVWTVTETARTGYLVSWQRTAGGTVTDGETESAGSGENGIVLNGNRVVFTNTATYILPETGGAGTTSYTMAGLVLILISAAYFVYSKKRRREAR